MRIAVTVDMISTGIDVKPIECVFFMRNVASAGFFEQMKGRGVRVISPDKLRAVTPSARVKDRFIVVDAVGVCERDKTDSRPLSRPPLAVTPVQLWRAFEAAEPAKVKAVAGRSGGGELLADLVNLVRVALIPDFTLVPYREEMRKRYRTWLEKRDADHAFTAEQREWLDRMAEYIATSLAIEPEDFETGWFGQQGSLGRAHALFGDRLKPLIAELNEQLAA